MKIFEREEMLREEGRSELRKELEREQQRAQNAELELVRLKEELEQLKQKTDPRHTKNAEGNRE